MSSLGTWSTHHPYWTLQLRVFNLPLLPTELCVCSVGLCKTRAMTDWPYFIRSSHGLHCKWITNPVLGSRKTFSWDIFLYRETSIKGAVGMTSLVWKTEVFLAKSAAGNSQAKNHYQWTALNIGLGGLRSFLLQLSCLQNRHPRKSAGFRQQRAVVFYKPDVVNFSCLFVGKFIPQQAVSSF